MNVDDGKLTVFFLDAEGFSSCDCLFWKIIVAILSPTKLVGIDDFEELVDRKFHP